MRRLGLSDITAKEPRSAGGVVDAKVAVWMVLVTERFKELEPLSLAFSLCAFFRT